MRLRSVIFVLLITSIAEAQHTGDYIQYMFNGALLNPAYAGSQGALNLTGLYRHQWVGVEGAPISKSFSAHSPLKNKNLNLGLVVENDRYAVYDFTRLSAQYAYRVKLSRGYLALGLQAGVELNSNNWNKMVVTDNNDPNFVSAATRTTNLIAGTGFYYHTDKFYLGFSVPHLLMNNVSTPRTIVANTGCIINLSEDFKMKPSLLFKQLQGSPVYLNLASTFYYKEIAGLGAGYTINSSWMVFMDVSLTEQLHFGYGYDYAVNKLKSYSRGSHEIMLRYLFRYKLKAVNARYF